MMPSSRVVRWVGIVRRTSRVVSMLSGGFGGWSRSSYRRASCPTWRGERWLVMAAREIGW